MKNLTALVGALALLLVPALQAADPVRPQDAAQAAAESWLALFDGGKYAESWQKSADLLQKAVGQERFAEAMSGLRTPFGKVLSRKIFSAQYTQTMAGAPDGEYYILQFNTSFEHKKSAVETVTPMKDKDGAWKVSGYFVK